MALKVGLIGCGSIGTVIAKFLDSDKNFELAYILDDDMDKCKRLSSGLKGPPASVIRVQDMEGVDLIIEAASQECVGERMFSALEKADVMIMSVGAFSDSGLFERIKAKAEKHKRKVYIPSGAIPGLDGIKAAAVNGLKKVALVSRKPPKNLHGSPGAAKFRIGMDAITKPTVIYEGSAEEAAQLFPRSINVSVALSLAGLGVKKTAVKVVADPFVKRNVHEIHAEGKFGMMTLRTENLPSPGNKKTSYLAALSAIATLKRIRESMQIGT
jgi:aspartate dehydrogenase